MDWIEGLKNAEQKASEKNAILLVFFHGSNEASTKLETFLNDEEIVKKTQTDFVAVKIHSADIDYVDFAKIYLFVPVPSIFFLSNKNQPLHICTELVASVEELSTSVDKVLIAAGKTAPTEQKKEIAVCSSVIDTEDPSIADSAYFANTDSGSTVTATEDFKETEKSEEDPCCSKQIIITENKVKEIQSKEPVKENMVNDSTQNMTDAPKRIETKTIGNAPKNKRRKLNDDKDKIERLQKEKELKEIMEETRRRRLDHERVLNQIAADRAERALNNTSAPVPLASPLQVETEALKSIDGATTTRIQFTLASGERKMHMFNRTDKFLVVREYVKNVVLSEKRNKIVSLITTYPRHEFILSDDEKDLNELNLVPSAVILVIEPPGSNTGTSLSHNAFVNVFYTIFTTILSPFFSAFNFLKRAAIGNKTRQPDRQEQHTDKQDREKERERHRDVNDQWIRKRFGSSNIHGLRDNQDSDDENATWNGNSTQQQ